MSISTYGYIIDVKFKPHSYVASCLIHLAIILLSFYVNYNHSTLFTYATEYPHSYKP